MTRREFGLSTYDLHRDGSGVCHASRLRPLLQMRPKQTLYNFNADLHVIDWLEAAGEPFDVVDDETLHREGIDLLRPYLCVVTGTHPEYHSTRMLRALSEYTRSGGRLMYLGGNGFYWRIAWDPAGGIEVRRGESGTRTWTGQPGEAHLSLTGEPGGLWRSSGHPPQRLVGIGYASEGFDLGSHYRRASDSHEPRAAFIFEGVSEGRIGDFGPYGGAAALELDIVDPALGTPPHALRVAASECHSNVYLLTTEELPANYPGVDGIENPLVRADMVFFETPGGGGVFSTGSIGWASSLSHNGYDNNVARITGNVLRRFVDPKPFPMPT
jgi:N,N-dimethylformamidase